MAESPKIHRVSREDLEIGERVEAKEHPWASPRVVRHLARDHLQRNPNAYSGGGCGGGTTEINLNQNIKVRPMRKKKPTPPKQQGFSWQNYGSELL